MDIGGNRFIQTAAFSNRQIAMTTDPRLQIADTIPFPTSKPVELVVRSEEEWLNALKNYAAYRQAQQRPPVNFQTHMLLIVGGGVSYDSAAYVSILGAALSGDTLEVAVDKYLPAASGYVDYDKVYFPGSVVIMPRTEGAANFVDVDKWIDDKAPDLKGSVAGGLDSAKSLLRAHLMLNRVARLYAGTPWGDIAQRLLPLNSYALSTVSVVPRPPEIPEEVWRKIPGDLRQRWYSLTNAERKKAIDDALYEPPTVPGGA
jgi:hypothetical protein